MTPNHSVSWYWLSTAEISPCGLYRTSLTRSRRFPIGCAVLSVTMLNPSTADATKNDPTIKRLLGFCDRLGFDELIVTNLWSLRATDPSDLAKAPDMGAFDEPILKAASQAKVVVVAWGASVTKIPGGVARAAHVVEMLRVFGPRRFGAPTKDGHPRHPLYLPTHVELEPLNIATGD